MHSLWRLLVEYNPHLVRVHRYSFYRYHVPKKWYFTQPELTFTKFCIELMSSQLLEHNVEMSLMLFHVLGKD
jgi:hypothetical protein